MRNFILSVFISVLTVVFMASCKPQVPSKYLQPDDMENILYDYHLLLGTLEEDNFDSLDLRKRMFEMAVLTKYGVSQADFDSSMAYYSRHADRFHDIYENISQRLSNEALSLGASANDMADFGSSQGIGDTVNVWKGAMSAVLSTVVPDNVLSFSLDADTAFHKGDRIILSFNTQFLFQDGFKDGVAMLAVTFTNDSVAVQTLHLSSSQRYSLQVGDETNLGIKEIRGFVSLQKPRNSTETTLKLMFLDNIRLVRCRPLTSVPVKNDGSASDSADVPRREISKPQ